MRQAGELATFLHSLDPPEEGAEGQTDNPLAGGALPVREAFGADASMACADCGPVFCAVARCAGRGGGAASPRVRGDDLRWYAALPCLLLRATASLSVHGVGRSDC